MNDSFLDNVDRGKQTLLIVEDDVGLQSQLRWHYEEYNVIVADNRTDALAALRRERPSVVLQDLGLPPDDEGVEEGFATLQEALVLDPNLKVIVVTGHADFDNAVRAVSMGAYDFYQKPVNTEVLDLIVQRAFQMAQLEQELRKQQEAASSPLQGIIASNPAMVKVCRSVEKLAPTNVTTLLLGESGTGKEVFARAIHALSEFSDNAFVAINCAAVPETLIESELFGYEKGAFTGANKQTLGKIETAQGGTLFLDEIGDMPLPAQAKLLRFLQERVIERVGGRKEISVDVRVVCATNKNLEQMVKDNTFREDLYYRISEIVVDIPPLRERQGDKILLARFVLEKFAKEHEKKINDFTPAAATAIEAYDWPGNIRELENKIKRAVIMSEGKKIDTGDLGLNEDNELSINLKTVRQNAERGAIRTALAIADGNMSACAKLLGITRPTLYDLMGKHGLNNE
ncbi:MAG: PEP-CTERM-box response regulator transcription factor [Gammaproteobacteria bacterium]|nr:PEP-CTERM-box response regulator transcription factor [Gammaproteobacteria bacterium]NND39270.1 PEP-CTERM-box response regulator transcription factor [Pseudomonadales bacterium]MBT8151033.1 PEP-CTERM-box response regulator transcription factor [Gammaproteobacteria bacterium]NNL10699.1 PEP-CTERM-box response regulator transcription factor [Pseudomonadales bacterium]NNM10689.1 PEP-CTERM-box response regulator transcription factor [Pseudomonadales bacterium]